MAGARSARGSGYPAGRTSLGSGVAYSLNPAAESLHSVSRLLRTNPPRLREHTPPTTLAFRVASRISLARGGEGLRALRATGG